MKVLLVTIATLWVAAACSNADAERPTTDVPVAAETARLKVATARAEVRPFEYRIEAEGTVGSAQEATLQFQTEGVLAEVHVRNGDQVRAKQTLARLEQAELRLAVERAEQTLSTRQDAYHLALLNAGGEFARPESVPEGRRQLLYLRSGVPDATTALKEARLRLRRATLRAPFAGRVADLQWRVGSLMTPATAFCYLYDPNHLTLDIEVLESDLPLIRPDLTASVTTLSYPDTAFAARVAEINARVSGAGRVRVRLRLLATSTLLPGMSARAVLSVPYEAHVIIPKTAVVMRSGRPVVFVHEAGLAKWHYVTPGRDNGTEIEIVEGLEAGTTVIISNNLQLAHDSPVDTVLAPAE